MNSCDEATPNVFILRDQEKSTFSDRCQELSWSRKVWLLWTYIWITVTSNTQPCMRYMYSIYGWTSFFTLFCCRFCNKQNFVLSMTIYCSYSEVLIWKASDGALSVLEAESGENQFSNSTRIVLFCVVQYCLFWYFTCCQFRPWKYYLYSLQNSCYPMWFEIPSCLMIRNAASTVPRQAAKLIASSFLEFEFNYIQLLFRFLWNIYFDLSEKRLTIDFIYLLLANWFTER